MLKRNMFVRTYSEARRLSRNDELDVSWYSVLTDTRLHPDLTEFITGLRQTWQNEYKSNMYKAQCVRCFCALTVLMAILASKLSTQLRTKSTGFPSSSPPWLKKTNRIFWCEDLNHWEEEKSKTRNRRVGSLTWCAPWNVWNSPLWWCCSCGSQMTHLGWCSCWVIWETCKQKDTERL